MKLSVYVMGRDVAVLDQSGDFKSVLSYHANTAPDDFVSLTMLARTESYVWENQLHPMLQMGSSKGDLLQEPFGQHIIKGSSKQLPFAVRQEHRLGRAADGCACKNQNVLTA